MGGMERGASHTGEELRTLPPDKQIRVTQGEMMILRHARIDTIWSSELNAGGEEEREVMPIQCNKPWTQKYTPASTH